MSGQARSLVPRFSMASLVALGIGAAVLLGVLLWPLLPGLVTSAVLGMLCFPIHERVRRRIRWPSVAAAVTTIGVLFLVLLPAAGMTVGLVAEIGRGIEALQQIDAGEEAKTAGRIAEWWQEMAAWLPFSDQLALADIDIVGQISNQLHDLAGLLASRTLDFLSGLGGWLLQLGVVIFTLFFLLRDGERLVEGARWLVPLEPAMTARLFTQVREVIFATFLGNVLVGLIQGILGGLAFWLAGLPAAALWGAVMALLGLLPAIGPPIVWLPAVVYLVLSGELWAAVGIFAFGSLVIGTVDNLLRAYLVGRRTQLHPLGVFLTVLGGLVMFGAVGVFAGPVLFVVCISLLEMARSALEEGRVPEEMIRETPLAGGILDVGRAAASTSGDSE